MGSWNGTCAVSNLHVTHGTKVAVFLLLRNKDPKSFCYNNALYDMCAVPFYGEYNDYGGVEECNGFGLPIVMSCLKDQLYKFGQGPNEYHDCEVTKENLTIELLFDADSEGRLGIEDYRRYDPDDYARRELEKQHHDKGLTESQMYELDRLANKIKKIDNFRQVTHAIVRQDILDAILEKWYIEDYVGDSKGNTGYNNNYVHIYFKDLIDSIPEYIRRLQEKESLARRIAAEGEVPEEMYRLLHKEVFDWKDPCMAGRWMNQFNDSGQGMDYGIVNVGEVVGEFRKIQEWEGLAKFAHEVLMTAWLNSYMTMTRKIWTKQSGAGGQNQDALGYTVLANAVLSILKADQDEWDKENGKDE